MRISARAAWPPAHLLCSFGFMVAVVLLGSLIFNRVEQTYMYTV